MADSIDIVMKINENISDKLKTIASTSQGCSKEMEDLARRTTQLGERYDKLNKQSAQASAAAAEFKKDLDAAKQLMKETGVAAEELDLAHLTEEYKRAADSAKQYQSLANAALRETTNSYEAFRKMEMGAFDSSGVPAEGGGFLSGVFGSGLGAGLAQSGIIRDLGNSLSGIAGTLIESAVGQPVATALSETLSGTVSGVAAGAIAGVPGMIAGGAIGAFAGALNAGNQIFQQKDDAFKAYVQENTEGQLAQRDADIQSGSAVAAQREQDAIAFNTMLGEGAGDTYLKDLRAMAAKTPMEYSDLTGMSRALATGFQDDPDRMLSLMASIGNAGSAVGADAGGMNAMATAMARMQSSGKTTLESLNLIQERGVDAVGMLSDGLGKTKAEIYDMISKGQIDGVNAVNIIQQAMDALYGGAMEKQSQTFSGLSSTLADAKTELEAAYGEGYNAERSKGISDEIDFLSGSGGERMQEANRAIGAWQASLENAKEEAIRNAVDNAMRSNDYRAAQAAGDAAKMGEIIARAKVQGQSEYNASEGAQLALESDKALAEAIRDDAASNQNYWDAGVEKGNWYTKGLAAAMGDFAFDRGTMDANCYDPITDTWHSYNSSNAFGLRRVPETGLYLLHRDETVRTAAESREKAGGGQILITGNQFEVRQESDVPAIAAEMLRQLELARMRAE